jgi:hypothetical protein
MLKWIPSLRGTVSGRKTERRNVSDNRLTQARVIQPRDGMNYIYLSKEQNMIIMTKQNDKAFYQTLEEHFTISEGG